MCVYLCVYTQFQNGYDLINIKSIKELIICSYKCVCVYMCVQRDRELSIYLSLSSGFSGSVQISKTLNHFHNKYTSACEIECLDFW